MDPLMKNLRNKLLLIRGVDHAFISLTEKSESLIDVKLISNGARNQPPVRKYAYNALGCAQSVSEIVAISAEDIQRVRRGFSMDEVDIKKQGERFQSRSHPCAIAEVAEQVKPEIAGATLILKGGQESSPLTVSCAKWHTGVANSAGYKPRFRLIYKKPLKSHNVGLPCFGRC